jgi:hypothetical protein
MGGAADGGRLLESLNSKARLDLLLLRPDRVLQTDAGCDTQTDLTAVGAWLSRSRHPAVRAAREGKYTTAWPTLNLGARIVRSFGLTPTAIRWRQR